MKYFVSIAGLLLAFQIQIAHGEEQSLGSRIASYVELMMRAEQIKGLSVGVVGPEKTSWAAGFGHANLAANHKATQYTLYPVASLTKLFTAMAIMQLADEEIIDLDKAVSDYLPGFTINSRFIDRSPVTIRQVLSHYAGLPRDLYKGLLSSDTDARPDLLEYLSTQYVAYPPEAKYVYSNIGYDLLGLVIEEVSGKTFTEFIREQVLTPLQMHDSYFYEQGTELAALSNAYIQHDNYHYTEFPQKQYASSGLYSTAQDMTQLLWWLMDGGASDPAVPAGLFRDMLSDHKSPRTLDVSFRSGWSWILEELPDETGGVYAYQFGSTMHFNAVIAIAPSYHVGVVLLCNTGGVLEVLENMARMIVFAAIMETGEVLSETTESYDIYTVVEPDTHDINRVLGHYLLQTDLFSVSEMASGVVLSTRGQTLQAFYHEDGWFSIEDSFRFTTDKLEDTRVLIVDRLGSIYPVGTDISGAYRLSPDIFERLGSYRLVGVNPRTETMIYSGANLSLTDGILQLRLILSPHQERVFGYGSALYNLVPKSGSEAVIAGFGMYKGETVFFGKDESGPYLMFSGLYFRLDPADEPG